LLIIICQLIFFLFVLLLANELFSFFSIVAFKGNLFNFYCLYVIQLIFISSLL